MKWWDLFKTKIQRRIIFYSKSQQSKTRRLQNILNERLHQAQLLQQHEQITSITLQLQQIERNKQKGSQIRSRISPFFSIDNPSPLATIKENLTQSKSLLTLDSNIPSIITSNQTYAVDFLSFLSFF